MDDVLDLIKTEIVMTVDSNKFTSPNSPRKTHESVLGEMTNYEKVLFTLSIKYDNETYGMFDKIQHGMVSGHTPQNIRISGDTPLRILERDVKIKYYLCNKLTVDRECEVCNCCKLKPVPRRAKCQN